MRRLAVLNLAQRIVVVVALGAALRIVWACFASRFPDDGGWFNYVPGEAEGIMVDPYVSSGWNPIPVLLAIVFISIWAGASVWLLGLPHSGSGGQSEPHPPDSN